MSIFGSSKSAQAADVQAPVIEGYGVDVNGDILAITESYEDQLAVVQALHSIDMEEIATRQEVGALTESADIEARQAEFEVVTESMVKDAWEKIKAFFMNLWGKLKAFFQSVVRVFDQHFKSGEAFIKKHESDLKKLNLNGFKYKMHTYTDLGAPAFEKIKVAQQYEKMSASVIKAASDSSKEGLKAIEADLDELKSDRAEYLNKARGNVLGSGSLTEEEFSKALYAQFRNGAKPGDDVQEVAVNLSEITAVLKDGSAKKTADALAKSTDDEFSRAIKTVNEVANKFKNGKVKDNAITVKHGDTEHSIGATHSAKAVEALRAAAGIMSAEKDIQMKAFRAWREAYQERSRVFKAVCNAAFRYKQDKK